MTNLSSIAQSTALPVAKLWNRNHATDRLAQEVKRSAQDPSYCFSILLVAFDGLCDITDRLGYSGGDDVWRRVLGLLLQDARPSDLCCRLGGDEFLLILPSRTETECHAIVEGIQRRWNPAVGTREATIDLGIGVAAYPAHGATVQDLMSAADQAMQSNKYGNEWARSVPELQQVA
jgi:diguanylate cyclase (GGDEF)-like protein